MKTLLIAAPSSGSGKTILTLGLLKALQRRGLHVAGAKSGPDYIDPAFHETACGMPSVNLDAWAMRPEALRRRAARQDSDLLLIEGAMGLFDGAPDGRGSAGDLAAVLGAPVILIMDVGKQSQTAAAIASGLARWREDVRIEGVILNRAGSERHISAIKKAMAHAGIEVLGAIPRSDTLHTPSRHLGLVQAAESDGLSQLISAAADLAEQHINLDRLTAKARPLHQPQPQASGLKPPGQHIAIARDIAFAFAYPHMMAEWQAAGAALSFFSPLADEAPDRRADAIFLPGGYPELHAGALAEAQNFRTAMQAAAQRGTMIYGECGGYMLLGEGLEDADGNRHQMLGLLPVETSFARRKLTLGYRMIEAENLPMGRRFSAHEFHYSRAIREEGAPLFTAFDALQNPLPPMGRRVGNVMGSYAHIIDNIDDSEPL